MSKKLCETHLAESPRITFSLPHTVYKSLQTESRKTGKSISEVIREIIKKARKEYY